MFLSPIALTCDRCKGSGKCPEIMLEWQAKGASIKRERLAQKIQLKEAAKLASIPIDIYSKIERGIINPDSYD